MGGCHTYILGTAIISALRYCLYSVSTVERPIVQFVFRVSNFDRRHNDFATKALAVKSDPCNS